MSPYLIRGLRCSPRRYQAWCDLGVGWVRHLPDDMDSGGSFDGRVETGWWIGRWIARLRMVHILKIGMCPFPCPAIRPLEWHSRVVGGFRSMKCFNHWDV